MNVLKPKLILLLLSVIFLEACNFNFKEHIEKHSDSELASSSTPHSFKKSCSEVWAKTICNLKLLNPCLKYSREKNMDRQLEIYSNNVRTSSEKARSSHLLKEAEYTAQQRSSELKQSTLEKSRPGNSHTITIQEKITIPISSNPRANNTPVLSP